MTKIFKEWEKVISKAEARAAVAVYAEGTAPLSVWPYAWQHPTIQEAQRCVYGEEDTRQWQAFRIGLKGMSTGEKLGALNAYWVDKVYCNSGPSRSNKERVRINNYIGALKRGGFLNDNLEVVK